MLRYEKEKEKKTNKLEPTLCKMSQIVCKSMMSVIVILFFSQTRQFIMYYYEKLQYTFFMSTHVSSLNSFITNTPISSN